jgi:hypothetical protein
MAGFCRREAGDEGKEAVHITPVFVQFAALPKYAARLSGAAKVWSGALLT